MAKDSYWFRHDSTAGRGLRMRKIAHIYGHWGKGVYWDVIEILRDQTDYRFKKDESSLQLLADLIGVKDEHKFINWFNDCVNINLLTTDEDTFFSEVLLQNMGLWEQHKNAGIQSGIKRIKRKLNETPTKVPTKVPTKRQHNRIEQNRIEDNKTNSSVYFLTAELNDLFVSYLEFRRSIKKPATDHAIELLVSQLKKYPNDEYRIKSIEQSIKNSWTGLFPVKQENAEQSNKPQNIR